MRYVESWAVEEGLSNNMNSVPGSGRPLHMLTRYVRSFHPSRSSNHTFPRVPYLYSLSQTAYVRHRIVLVRRTDTKTMLLPNEIGEGRDEG